MGHGQGRGCGCISWSSPKAEPAGSAWHRGELSSAIVLLCPAGHPTGAVVQGSQFLVGPSSLAASVVSSHTTNETYWSSLNRKQNLHLLRMVLPVFSVLTHIQMKLPVIPLTPKQSLHMFRKALSVSVAHQIKINREF